MTSRFIESVGRSYASDTLNDSVFMYEGEPYILNGISNNRDGYDDEDDHREDEDEDDGDEGEAFFTNCATGADKRLPLTVIKGWKSFKYPKLGYRSFGPSHAAFVFRRTSYARGLNEGNCMVQWTPLTDMVVRVGMDPIDAYSWRKRVKHIFNPDWHSKDDMDSLFSGKIPHVVFNEDAMIELRVLVPEADYGWDVFYRGTVVGQVNQVLSVKAANPHNHKLTERIVKRHAC